MIHELLYNGADHPRTGKQIAILLGCDIRTVTEQIERERREGYPICANMRGGNAGYFLAETPEELEQYCRMLYKRGSELFKTRRALLNVLSQLARTKEQEAAEPDEN